MLKVVLMSFLIISSTYSAAADCDKEAKKLCQDRSSDFGKCMKEKHHLLSPTCASDFKNIENVAADVGANCMEDISKFCPINIEAIGKDIEASAKKHSECIEKNKSRFSPKCSSLLKALSKAFGGKAGAGAKKIR